MKRVILSLLSVILMAFSVEAQVRSEQLLEKGWRFTREDSADFSRVGYDDSKWQEVVVPHDWAIYGPFSINNDKQNVAITQDGQKEAMEHAGRTGGLPFVGVGWYRLDFEAPAFEEGKRATILFDGAMSHARVYVNGEEVGFWRYGYNSFHFDITDYLKAGEVNELAVRLENKPESSRWYPGAGIYRNVHLIVTEDVYVPVWGTQLTTPRVSEELALVELRTKVNGYAESDRDN
ncbi:MAG: beta-galactosidase, partial [Alistipes sp.]|nr:beta-galactosidase [Alistipes sp.]